MTEPGAESEEQSGPDVDEIGCCCACSKPLEVGRVSCYDCGHDAHPWCSNMHIETKSFTCDVCERWERCKGCDGSFATKHGPAWHLCDECGTFTCNSCIGTCEHHGILCANEQCLRWNMDHEITCDMCNNAMCIDDSIVCTRCTTRICSDCTRNCPVMDHDLCEPCFNETCALHPHDINVTTTPEE